MRFFFQQLKKKKLMLIGEVQIWDGTKVLNVAGPFKALEGPFKALEFVNDVNTS